MQNRAVLAPVVVTAATAAALLAAAGHAGPASARTGGVPGGLPAGLCAYTPDPIGADFSRFAGVPPAVPSAPAPSTVVLGTNAGSITLALDPAAAPCTVNSFVFLARHGYFDGTECHRLLDSREAGLLQCGDPTATGRGGPGYEFGDENLRAASYERGVLAMANHGPWTNGSQFFMVFRTSGLHAAHTPFGKVTAGMDILDRVAAKGSFGPHGDRPYARLVIVKALVS